MSDPVEIKNAVIEHVSLTTAERGFMSDQPMTDERADRPSASSFGRLASCPRSWNFERELKARGIIESPQEWTFEGQQVASALEMGDTSELPEHLADLTERLEQMTQQAYSEWLERHQIDPETVLEMREERLWLRDARFNLLVSSQVDRAYINNKFNRVDGHYTALIIDHKTGFLQVDPAERNWQLRVQAVCLNHEQGQRLNTVDVAIAHARLGSKFDLATYDRTNLNHARLEILHSLWRADQPDAQAVPGGWCRYCLAKAECRVAQAWAWVDYFDAPTGQTLKIKHLPSLTDEQRSNIFRRHNASGAVLFEAVKERLKGLSDEQLESLGIVRKNTGDTRKITDKNRAAIILEGNGVLTGSNFDDCCTPSLTLLEKRVAEVQGISQKKAKELLNEHLAPVLDITPKERALKVKETP